MPPVQGPRIDDVTANMPPNNSDPLMERKHAGQNGRIPPNGHVIMAGGSDTIAMDINPWPSGGASATATNVHKQGFVCTLRKTSVFLLTLVFFSSLLLLGTDTERVQFETTKLSPKELAPKPVGCYLKTADRGGYFALMEEEELEKRGCDRRIPQTIIAGTKKGGTTTLKYFLSYHPDVAMGTKEMKFFNSNYKKGLEWYRENMPYSTENQVTIEKTPGYLYGHAIPEKMNTMLPEAKVIIIMRDPVRRAISDYVHMTSKINCGASNTSSKNCARVQERSVVLPAAEEPTSSSATNASGVTVPVQQKTFSKSLEQHEGLHYEIHESFEESVLFPNGTVKAHNLLVDKGVYIRHLEYWFKVFTPKRLLLLDGEKFVTDPAPTLQVIERFLGVRHYFTKEHFYYDEEKHFFCLNKPFRNCMSDSKGRNHPDVSEDVLLKLREFYRPYNERLSRYFNSSLLWSS